MMIMFLLLNAMVCADIDAIPRFEQDVFAIGLWVDPPIDEHADQRYEELAEANFTVVLGNASANTEEKIIKQLELCEKYNLKALVCYRCTELDTIPDSPALWGFMVHDEPSAQVFPGLGDIVRSLRESHPGKLAYINLYPSYAGSAALGTDTYEEHVSLFLEQTTIDVLSMDHYPLFRPGNDPRDAYCNDLDVMRTYSLQAGIPFWNFFNIMPFGQYTDPTEGQVRWQIYTSLTYGAKGVLYFCYNTPSGAEFPKGGAIITRDDRRTHHYYQAKRLNEEIKNLGPTLMQLTSSKLYRIAPDDTPAEKLAGAPIVDLQKADYDPDFDILLGAFKHTDGRHAVMLTNFRYAYSAWPTVIFDAPLEDIREIDKKSGKEIPVRDDSPDMEGLQISLQDGEGRLFLLP